MMKKIFPLWAVAAMLLLTACYHDQHELQPNEYDGKPVGYLTPLLLWDDPADAGTTTTIDDIRFTVSGQERCYLSLAVTTPEGTRLRGR